MLDLKPKNITETPHRQKPIGVRGSLSCLCFLLGMFALLHFAKAVYPIQKVQSVGTVKLLSHNVTAKNADEYLIAIPVRLEEGSRFSLLADGAPLELKPRSGSEMVPNSYILDNGFLCWKQSTPPAKHYSLLKGSYLKWSGIAGAVLLMLSVVLAGMGALYLFAQRTLASVCAIRDQLNQFFVKVAAIWNLHQYQSTNSAESSASFKFPLLVAGSCAAVLALVIYCNTGTLVPLNLFNALVVDRGLPSSVNIDHDFHYAIYMLVDGRGGDVELPYNMLFRRVLYTWLAYPAMKLLGFVTGGIVMSIALNVAGLIAFCTYTTRRWGRTAGTVSALLLCLYPGYAYFCGLPYCYSIIYPASLVSVMCLSEIERTKSLLRTIALSAVIGVLCLGYDLVVLVLPALALLLAWQRRFRDLVVACMTTVLPTTLWCCFLYKVCGPASLVNGNTSTFANAILAWTTITDPRVALHVVQSIPQAIGWLLWTGVFSTFAFLPILFALALVSGTVMKDCRLTKAEACFIGYCALLCLLCTLAPDCSASGFGGSLGEWQPKGSWTIRLYQPLFAVYVLYLARKWGGLKTATPSVRALLNTALILALIGNCLTSFGTVLNNPLGLAGRLFYEFNPTGSMEKFQWNLATYGRLPLGLFDPEKAKQVQSRKDLSAVKYFAELRANVPPLAGARENREKRNE